jgi:Uma2 family endonuclease
LLWEEVMLLTIEEYCKRTDIDPPTELVRGVLVRHNFPFLIHGIVCSNIAYELGKWHKAHGNGIPIALHGVITRRNPESLRSIDVAYYDDGPLRERLDDNTYLEIMPKVAFEVRSHDENWIDMTQKVSEFIEAGTKVFVVVDPFVKTVHVFEPQQRVLLLADEDVVSLSNTLPGLSFSVRALFE